jgi:hypothetical protein
MSSLDSFSASGSSPQSTQSIGADFICSGYGSLYLLRPITDNARFWIDAHLDPDRQTFGDSVVVEHRYIWNILIAIQDDGLVVSRG